MAVSPQERKAAGKAPKVAITARLRDQCLYSPKAPAQPVT